MPELPETHTISSLLDQILHGMLVKSVKVSEGYNTFPSNEFFIKNITGARFVTVSRRAKNILLELDNKLFLRFHLAMTGRILLDPPDDTRWVRVSLDLGDKTLVFTDMRKFGKVGILDKKGMDTLDAAYGLDALDPKLTPTAFHKIITSKKTVIKNALLDQKIISGLGNIYANDALFVAKINPKRKTSDLNFEESQRLLNSIRKVLNESIKLGGSTLTDKMYVDPFGKEGKYQDHFKIYSREKCSVCNSKVEVIKISGRSTYYCPQCQTEK